MKVFLFRCFPPRWLLALICAGPLCAESTSLETVEKSAGDWLKVRAETARLETEWSTQRQLLDSMAHGLEERATTLETRRDFLRAKTTKDREELANLEASNKKTGGAIVTCSNVVRNAVMVFSEYENSGWCCGHTPVRHDARRMDAGSQDLGDHLYDGGGASA